LESFSDEFARLARTPEQQRLAEQFKAFVQDVTGADMREAFEKILGPKTMDAPAIDYEKVIFGEGKLEPQKQQQQQERVQRKSEQEQKQQQHRAQQQQQQQEQKQQQRERAQQKSDQDKKEVRAQQQQQQERVSDNPSRSNSSSAFNNSRGKIKFSKRNNVSVYPNSSSKSLLLNSNNVWRSTVSIWNSRSVSHKSALRCCSDKSAWRNIVFRSNI